MILLVEPNNFNPSFFSKLRFFLSANKFLIIFISILTALSFSVSGYLVMSNKKSPSSDNLAQENIAMPPSPTSLPQKVISNISPPSAPTPTVAVTNLTASWNAYISSNYSYSVKYPMGWTAQKTTQSDPKILEYVVFNPTATKAGTLSITLSYGTRTYSQALALDPQIGETILVASVSSTKKSTKDSNGNKATGIIVPISAGTIIFNAKEAFSGIFNQMLSTLKLTK